MSQREPDVELEPDVEIDEEVFEPGESRVTVIRLSLTAALGGFLFGINSICHFFGRRRFPTPDRSTNVAWLSVHTLPGAKVSFGELECTAEVGLNL